MTYCTRADMNSRFGAENIDYWATLGDPNDVPGRIDWAIAEATQLVDANMRDGIYPVPFASVTDNPSTPGEIRSIAATLAGIELRRIRAVESTPDGTDPLYQSQRQASLLMLRKYARGFSILDEVEPDATTGVKAVPNVRTIDSRTETDSRNSTT